MSTTTIPTITHRITYDRFTKDFACYVQIEGDPEQYIGSAATYHAGETTCLDYRRDLLLDSRPIPRCDDCKSALGDFGRCETCDDRAEPAGPCKRDILGDYWLICRAPGDGPCMCDVVLLALPARPTPRILCACGQPALIEEPHGTFCGDCYEEAPVVQAAPSIFCACSSAGVIAHPEGPFCGPCYEAHSLWRLWMNDPAGLIVELQRDHGRLGEMATRVARYLSRRAGVNLGADSVLSAWRRFLDEELVQAVA